MVGLTTGAIMGMIAVLGTGLNYWTEWGWVTKGQFAEVSAQHLTTEDLESFRANHLSNDIHVLATQQAIDEMSDVEDKLNRILVSTLRDEILELQETICNATTVEARQQAQSDLVAALEEYEEVAERSFPQALLNCD